ncbi:MAG: LPS-assembly protein LptD [Deltaproteobacteria bacterium]|nr:LPS-assembly protein LptD [Deltaproteobacteria bacterium]
MKSEIRISFKPDLHFADVAFHLVLIFQLRNLYGLWRQIISTQIKTKHAFFFIAVLALIISYGGISSAKISLPTEHFLDNENIPWQITADRLIYKVDGKVYVAEGDVIIKKGDQRLYAQKAVYSMESGIAKMSGNVRLESDKDILRGDQGVFDLKNQSGKINNGQIFLSENHYYISGSVIEKTAEKTYIIKDCRLTTCDGDKPDWTITGSAIKVTIEDYGTIKHATFRIKDIPIFYIPYMIFPAKTSRQTGFLLPRAGDSTRNGAIIELPFFWAISDQTDATFYQRYMSKRGYMQGLEFRYQADENSEGLLLMDILSDRKDKDLNDSDDVDISPFDRTNNTRYWVRGKSDQDLPLDILARLDIDYVSDQDYLREFDKGLFGIDARPDLEKESGRPVEEKKSPTRRSALRLSRDFDDVSLQALSSYNQPQDKSLDDETPQSLAGLDFILPHKQVMKLPMFYSLESDYEYIWRKAGEKGHQVSLVPELRFPLLRGPYLEFEPVFRYQYNMQWFDNIEGRNEHQNRKAYETGARLSTNLERIYDPGWSRVKKLKHKITPTFKYNYRVNQSEEDKSPWFNSIDAEGDQNLITFSLENYLDARVEDKKGNVKYRQWAKLNLIQGYDIDEERHDKERGEERRPFTPLALTLDVTSIRYIDCDAEIRWNHYDHELEYADLSLTALIDRLGGRKDTYKLNYLYEKDNFKNINLEINLNLVHGFSIGGLWEKDLELHERISNQYWLDYESQCWGVRIGAEWEDKVTSVSASFRLIGLADIM